METQTIWSKVGRWFRKTDRVGLPTDSAGLPTDSVGVPTDSTTHLTTPDVVENRREGSAPDRSGSHLVRSLDSTGVTPVTKPERPRATGLFRRSRSNPDLERLEAQYARVGNLMDAIERHMESQSDRSERIACSLDSLAQSLTGVPEAFRHQLEVLSNIRETVIAEQARAGRLEESLAQWPRVADAQRETMVSISRQLDEAREANAGTTATVEQCRDAFAKVEETTGASTKAIERFAGESRAGADRMATLLETQAARFQLFAWAAIVLAGVAAVIAVISLLK